MISRATITDEETSNDGSSLNNDGNGTFTCQMRCVRTMPTIINDRHTTIRNPNVTKSSDQGNQEGVREDRRDTRDRRGTGNKDRTNKVNSFRESDWNKERDTKIIIFFF
jgi:hypothetical protein